MTEAPVPRRPSIALRIALGVVLFVVLLVGGVLVALTTRTGQAYIAARVLEVVNGGNLHVTIARTDGAWPEHIVLDGITVADRQGPWLTLDHLDLHIATSALLRGHLTVKSLALGTAHVARLPVSAPSTTPPQPLDPQGILRNMRRVTVQALEIGAVDLDPSIAGQALSLHATATLIPDGDGSTLTAAVQRRDGDGRVDLTVQANPRSLTAKIAGVLAGVRADGQTTVQLNGGALAGTLTLDCAGPCYSRDQLHLAHAHVDATFGGTVKEPAVDARFVAEDGTIAKRTVRGLDGALKVAIADDRTRTTRFSGTGTAAGLKAAAPEAAAVIGDTAAWSVQGSNAAGRMVIDSLTARSGGSELSADATITPDGIAPAHINMTLRAAGQLAGMPQDHSITRATITVDRAMKDGTAAGSLSVRMSELTPPRQLAGVLGTTASVDARLAADQRGLRLTDASIVSGNLDVRGDSTWTGDRAALDHATTHVTLHVDAKSLTGAPTSTNATFTLTGPLATLKGVLDVQIPELRLVNAPPAQNLHLVGEGVRRGKGFEASLKGDGRWREQPVDVQVHASKGETPVIAVSQIHIASAAAVIDGAGDMNTADNTFTGKIGGRVADLAVIGAFANMPLEGSGDFAVALAAPDGKQRIDTTVHLARVRQANISADGMSITAAVEDARGAAQVRARLDSGGGALLGRPVKSLAATVNGPLADMAVTFDLVGAAREPLSLSLAGTVGMGSATTVALSRFRARDGALTAELMAPARFSMSRDDVTLGSTRVRIAGGTVSADFRLDRRGNTANGNVAFQNIALKDFAAAAPTLSAPANTTLDGRIALSGPMTAAVIDATLGAGFDTGQGRGRLELKALARNGRASITGTGAGFSPTPATLNAEIPIVVNLEAMRAGLDMEAPFRAALKWSGDIGPVWRLVPLDEHVLSGAMVVDISASGRLSAPAVRGEIRLSDGHYENLVQSTVLQHVNAALTAQSTEAFTFSLSATDRKSGTVTGSGSVAADQTGAWRADITTTFKDLAAVNRDDITTSVTGDVSYRGPLTAGTLAGKLELRNAEVRIDQFSPPPVPLLRPLTAVETEGANAKTGQPPAPPLAVALKLTVNIVEPIRIDGKGLDSWWIGTVNVAGTSAAPDVTGEMRVDRGTFSILGQTFTLDPASKVSLTGGGKMDPDLAITATRQTTDIVVTANITGTGSAPKVELTSRPPLPQDEVLARLLFQKQSSQLGPLESVQLASAAAELTGLSRGGLSGLLQRKLGIDTVGLGGQSGNALVLGQQFGRRLYVGIEQNLTGTGRQIVLEWRLTHGLALRSTNSDQTGSDIGVSWRKDY